MGDPVFDPLNKSLPAPVMARPFFVREGSVNTFRLMQDPPRTSNRLSGGRPVSVANEVKYYVNGEEAFPEMAAAVRTANRDGHFVYLVNWFVDVSLKLDGTDTLLTLLGAAASAGAQVRALFWKNYAMADGLPPWYRVIVRDAFSWIPDGRGGWAPPTGVSVKTPADIPPMYAGALGQAGVLKLHGVAPYHNDAEAYAIDALPLPPGKAVGFHAAILDSQVPFGGAHHQKMLIVNGTQGLLAFTGGIDFRFDRLFGLYDVHCRVRGPGADALLSVFNERWVNHPDRAAADKGQPHVGTSIPASASIGGEVCDVEVARTYADPTRNVQVSPTTDILQALVSRARASDAFYHGRGYTFAPTGSTQVWDLYKRAVTNARRFIYMENQYFTSVELAQLLASALPNVKHLTLLITQWSDIGDDGGLARTQRCIDIVRAADTNNKFKPFVRLRKTNDARHDYVHAKLLIADDQYAIIGSANGARRSFDCDSEVAIGVFDKVPDGVLQASFARRLRMRLWADHFPGTKLEDFADGTAGGYLWDVVASVSDPPTTGQGWAIWTWENWANLWRTQNGRSPSLGSDWEWDQIRDPLAPGPT